VLVVQCVEDWPVFFDEFSNPGPMGREILILLCLLFTPTHEY
jgi:hypothetical protein